MSTREQILHNLRVSLHSFGSVIDALTPDQWNAQSLCPAWTAHGVVAHTTAIEAALLGWRPDSPDNPFALMGPIAQELSGLSPAALRARFHEVVAARLLELEAMSDDEFTAPSFTPVGQATYARFMAIRVFDIWVHERDIRVPLDIPGDDGGPAAEMALDEVEGSIGYIAGKKIGVPDGQGLAFHLTGPVRRDIFVKVDGRAARVPELVDPDAVLTADSLTFVLLACGRINPDEPIRDGRVAWSGDPALGERAARNLAFTM
ncbi:MAG: maleylpyruvate isomerase family mycothiol-dependent enzyme [Ilumatobacteraceae bacterium]